MRQVMLSAKADLIARLQKMREEETKVLEVQAQELAESLAALDAFESHTEAKLHQPSKQQAAPSPSPSAAAPADSSGRANAKINPNVLHEKKSLMEDHGRSCEKANKCLSAMPWLESGIGSGPVDGVHNVCELGGNASTGSGSGSGAASSVGAPSLSISAAVKEWLRQSRVEVRVCTGPACNLCRRAGSASVSTVDPSSAGRLGSRLIGSCGLGSISCLVGGVV